MTTTSQHNPCPTDRRPHPRAPRRSFLWLLPLTVALAAGCGGPISLNPDLGPEALGDYEHVRDEWTRTAEDYYRFEGRLFVSATYYAPAFRRAWLERASELFQWNESARVEAQHELDQRARSYHTFFVSVATPDWRWNRLDRDDNLWAVWLEDDRGRRVKAAEIERIREKRPEMAVFFPHLGPFSEGYIVRFPRSGGAAGAAHAQSPRVEPGTRFFALIVTGAPAGVRLQWDLDE